MNKLYNKNTHRVKKSFNKVSRIRYNKNSVKKSNRRYKRTIKKRNNKKSIKRRSKYLQVGGNTGIKIKWLESPDPKTTPRYRMKMVTLPTRILSSIRWKNSETFRVPVIENIENRTTASKHPDLRAGLHLLEIDGVNFTDSNFYSLFEKLAYRKDIALGFWNPHFRYGELEKTFSKKRRQFFNAYVINYIKDKILCVPQLDTSTDADKYLRLIRTLGGKVNDHYPFKLFFNELGITVPEYKYVPAPEVEPADAPPADAPPAEAPPRPFKFALLRHSESESNWLVSETLRKWYGYISAFLTPYGRALAFSTGYYKLYEEVYLKGEQIKLYSSTLPRSMITAMLLLRGLIKRINDEIEKATDAGLPTDQLNRYLENIDKTIKVVYGISEIPAELAPYYNHWPWDGYAQRIMDANMLVPMVNFLNNIDGGEYDWGRVQLVLDNDKPYLWEEGDDTVKYASSAHSLNKFFDKLYNFGEGDDDLNTRHIFVVHGILMEKYVSWPFFIEYFKDINEGPTSAYDLIPRANSQPIFGELPYGSPEIDVINFNINKILNYFIDLVNPERKVFMGPFKCWKKKPRLRLWEKRCVVIEGKSLSIYDDGDILGDPRGSSIDDITDATFDVPHDVTMVSLPNFGIGDWELLTVNKDGYESVELAFEGLETRDTIHLAFTSTIEEYLNEGNTFCWESAMNGITGNELATRIEDIWSKLLFFGSKRKCETIKGLIDNIHAFHNDIPELSHFKQQHYDKLLQIEYGIKLFIDYTMRVAMDLDNEQYGLSSIMETINDPRNVGHEWLRGYSGVTMNDEEDQGLADAIDEALTRASVAHAPAEGAPVGVRLEETMLPEEIGVDAGAFAAARGKIEESDDSIEQLHEKFKKLMYAPLGKTPNNCSMVMGTLERPKPNIHYAIYPISNNIEYKIGKGKTGDWIGSSSIRIVGNRVMEIQDGGRSIQINLNKLSKFGPLKTKMSDRPYSLRLDFTDYMMDIIVPEEFVPGQTITFTTPAGENVEEVVPDGLQPGEMFQVSVDFHKIIIDLKTPEDFNKMGTILTIMLNSDEGWGQNFLPETKDNLRNIYLLHRLKDVKFVSPSLRFKTTNQNYLRPNSDVQGYRTLLDILERNTPSDIHHTDKIIKELFNTVERERELEQDVLIMERAEEAIQNRLYPRMEEVKTSDMRGNDYKLNIEYINDDKLSNPSTFTAINIKTIEDIRTAVREYLHKDINKIDYYDEDFNDWILLDKHNFDEVKDNMRLKVFERKEGGYNSKAKKKYNTKKKSKANKKSKAKK